MGLVVAGVNWDPDSEIAATDPDRWGATRGYDADGELAAGVNWDPDSEIASMDTDGEKADNNLSDLKDFANHDEIPPPKDGGEAEDDEDDDGDEDEEDDEDDEDGGKLTVAKGWTGVLKYVLGSLFFSLRSLVFIIIILFYWFREGLRGSPWATLKAAVWDSGARYPKIGVLLLVFMFPLIAQMPCGMRPKMFCHFSCKWQSKQQTCVPKAKTKSWGKWLGLKALKMVMVLPLLIFVPIIFFYPGGLAGLSRPYSGDEMVDLRSYSDGYIDCNDQLQPLSSDKTEISSQAIVVLPKSIQKKDPYNVVVAVPGNCMTALDMVQEFSSVCRQTNTALIVMEHPGYKGNSEPLNSSSRVGMIKNAIDKVTTKLEGDHNFDCANIFVVSHSIGNGAANEFSAQFQDTEKQKLMGVANIAPFSSGAEIVQQNLPMPRVFAKGLVAGHQLDNKKNLLKTMQNFSNSKDPKQILIAHGAEDEVIKPYHSQSIVDALMDQNPTKVKVDYHVEPSAHHNNLLGNADVQRKIRKMINPNL